MKFKEEILTFCFVIVFCAGLFWCLKWIEVKQTKILNRGKVANDYKIR